MKKVWLIFFTFCLCNIAKSQEEIIIDGLGINLSYPETVNINRSDTEYFYQDLKRGIAVINDHEYNGSCFLVNTVNNSFKDTNRKVYIMTADHVINETFEVLNEEATSYISFDYELAHAINRGDHDIDANIRRVYKVKLKLVVGQSYEEHGADLSLMELVFDETNPLPPFNKLISNSYALGWNLHPKGPYSNISHPGADHKKIYQNARNISTSNYLDDDDEGLMQYKFFKIKQRNDVSNGAWENEAPLVEGGSSGSPLIDANHQITAVNSEGTGNNLFGGINDFSAIENAWYLLKEGSREQDFMTFLDPDKTWISSVKGGYFNDLIPFEIPNDSYFNLTVPQIALMSSPFTIHGNDFFWFSIPENRNEITLGHGILLPEDSNTIALGNKVEFSLGTSSGDEIYKVFYDHEMNDIGTVFKGKDEEFIFPAPFGNIDSSDIKNALLRRMGIVDEYSEAALNYLSTFSLDVVASLNTTSENAQVRAIKLPYQMPYNARELFEEDPYASLWKSYRYKESFGSYSEDLHIIDIKVELEQYLPSPDGTDCILQPKRTLQTISTDDNGGYLNLVNPNYLINNIVASEDGCPDNKLILTLATGDNNTKYYGGWLDYWKHRKGLINNNPNDENSYTYNFVEDDEEHLDEILGLDNEEDSEIYFEADIPKYTELISEFNGKDEYQTRLRVAVADQPQEGESTLIQDGIYKEGEVEDYLVRIRKSNCDDKKQYAKRSKGLLVSIEESINTHVSDCTDIPSSSPTIPTITADETCHELGGECVNTNTCGDLNLTAANETAWNFNNTDSYIDLNTQNLLGNNSSSSLDALTVSFNMYAPHALSTGTTQYNFSLGDNTTGLTIRQNGSNIELGLATTNTTAGAIVLESPLPISQWVNVTAVYDGENNPNITSDGILKLYINDVQVATSNAPDELQFTNQNQVETTFADATNSTLLQNTFTSAPSSNADIVSFDGALANLSIYLSALSAAEVEYFNCENDFPIPSFGISYESLVVNTSDLEKSGKEKSDDKEKQTYDFSIFPNPATDKLNILVEVSQEGPLQIDIYDMNGRQVYTLSRPKITQGHQLITLPVEDLSAGNYVMKIRAGDVLRSEQFIVG